MMRNMPLPSGSVAVRIITIALLFAGAGRDNPVLDVSGLGLAGVALAGAVVR